MEGALVNTLSPNDEILVIVAGKFGERWAEMAERLNLRVHRLEVPWGQAIDLKQVASALKKHKVKAVCFQAVETSTATAAPVKELAETIRANSDALILVDAITALGAMELPMDQWGLDVVIAGSQKALMLPTGLAFIALSKKAWTANKTARIPRYYFDLEQEMEFNKKDQTFFSSANSHVVALDVVLEKFKGLGLKWLQSRCALQAQATRAAGEVLGMKTFSKNPANSVTALVVPDGVNGGKLRDHLEQTYNVTVMGGQDQLQGKILRIGHLGYITDDDLTQGIALLGQSLNDLGVKADSKKAIEAVKAVLQAGPNVP